MKKLFQKHVVHTKLDIYVFITRNNTHVPGADPGFQIKKIAPSGGSIWVFRVKNHDFMQKNHIFSNFIGPPPWTLPCVHTNKIRVSQIRFRDILL